MTGQVCLTIVADADRQPITVTLEGRQVEDMPPETYAVDAYWAREGRTGARPDAARVMRTWLGAWSTNHGPETGYDLTYPTLDDALRAVGAAVANDLRRKDRVTLTPRERLTAARAFLDGRGATNGQPGSPVWLDDLRSILGEEDPPEVSAVVHVARIEPGRVILDVSMPGSLPRAYHLGPDETLTIPLAVREIP